MQFTVMSSNVWGNCPDNRPIADRDDKMAVVFLKYLPDSIGLQECSPLLRRERQNLFSLISKEYADVNKIAGVYGGGGHVRAAGCMLFGDLEEVLDKLSYTVSQYLE